MRFTPTDGPALIFLGMFVLSISLTAAFVGLDTLARIVAIVGLVLSGFGLWPELSYHSSQTQGQLTR
ncbi:hypothetical protein E6H16_07490 [Candidatus Bathyarchaeota archaeon]|nr:MAG: hypothetical protein E6H16_07490 [Candidatus Bathyarchaeota archaeon]